MAESSTPDPQPVDKSSGKDIVLGSGVRLRKLHDIHAELQETGLSYRGLIALVRKLNIPIIHLGSDAYVNPFFFQLAMYAITRPGSPDFLMPGCRVLKKNRKHKHPSVRELSDEYFRENIHTFITEIISARRFNFRRAHGSYVEQVNKIVEKITQQYDVLGGPTAAAKFKRAALQANTRHHLSSESPLQKRDPRISSIQRASDVDPMLSPKVNAPRYTPPKDKDHENHRR